jgi:hypothetical protein
MDRYQGGIVQTVTMLTIRPLPHGREDQRYRSRFKVMSLTHVCGYRSRVPASGVHRQRGDGSIAPFPSRPLALLVRVFLAWWRWPRAPWSALGRHGVVAVVVHPLLLGSRASCSHLVVKVTCLGDAGPARSGLHFVVGVAALVAPTLLCT